MKANVQFLKGRNYLLISLLVVGTFLTYSCNTNYKNPDTSELHTKPDTQAEDSVFSILAHYYNENPDSAITYSLSYEKELLAAKEYRGLTRLYSFMSELYQYRINDNVLALQYISKALDVLAEHPDIYFDNPYLFINAGNILYNYGMYHEAIYVYQEIENVVDLNQRPEVRTLIDNNIGLAYQGQSLCDSAKKYFLKAKDEIYLVDNRAAIMEVQCLNYLSSLTTVCGEEDSIPHYYQLSLPLFAAMDSIENDPEREDLWNDIRLEYISSKLSTITNMGKYERNQGNYQSSLDYLFEALNQAKLIKHYAWTSVIRSEISLTYKSMKDLDTALVFIDQAIAQIPNEASRDYNLFIQLYTHKANILKEQGKYNLAVAAENQVRNYNDQLLSYTQSEEISSQKIELTVKPIQFSMKKIELRKNQMLETVRMQLQISEQKEKLAQYRWMTLTGILIILILILFFLFYRSKSKKILAELSLENAEKEKKFMTSELQNFSMHLVYRNDFLKELQTKLKQLGKEANEKNKKKIKEINIEISQNLQSSHDAKIIDEKINEINSGFLFSLSGKYPNLTENDKNLCALVRMNLSSKEIASIRSISERSVITARYRLRQKLGLGSNQNLSEFLKQI